MHKSHQLPKTKMYNVLKFRDDDLGNCFKSVKGSLAF